MVGKETLSLVVKWGRGPWMVSPCSGDCFCVALMFMEENRLPVMEGKKNFISNGG